LKKKGKGRLDSDLISWCEYLEKRVIFFQKLARTGGKIEFYVSVFLDGDRGFEFNNSLLQRIYTLGLGLSVEMYRLSDAEAATSKG
jgi:hypothetical protein